MKSNEPSVDLYNRLQMFLQICDAPNASARVVTEQFETITPLLSRLDGKTLISIINIVRKLNYYDPIFWHMYNEAAALKANDFSANDIADILHAFIDFTRVDRPLFLKLIDRVISLMPELSISSLANIGHSFSKLKLYDTAFAQSWIDCVRNKLDHTANHLDLAKILFSLAKSDYNNQDIVNKWIEVSQNQYSQRLDPRKIINNAFYLTMLLVNNFPLQTENVEKAMVRAAVLKLLDKFDYSKASTEEEKRQLLGIHSALFGSADYLLPAEKQECIQAWSEQIAKDSLVSSSQTQNKVSSFIKRVFPLVKVVDEKWIENGFRHADIYLSPINTIVEVNGLKHFYINLRGEGYTANVDSTTAFHKNLAMMGGYHCIEIDYRDVDDLARQKAFQSKLLAEINPIITEYQEAQATTSAATFSAFATTTEEKPAILIEPAQAVTAKTSSKKKNKKIQGSDDNEEVVTSSMTTLRPAASPEDMYKAVVKKYKPERNNSKFKNKSVLYIAVMKKELESVQAILNHYNANKSQAELTLFAGNVLDLALQETAEVFPEKEYLDWIRNQKSLDICESLLAADVQMRSEYTHDITSFIISFNHKNLAMVEHILNQMPESTSKLQFMELSFIVAAHNDDLKTVQFFLDKGIDKDIAHSRGRIAVWRRAFDGAKHETGEFKPQHLKLFIDSVQSAIYGDEASRKNSLIPILDNISELSFDMNSQKRVKLVERGATALHMTCYSNAIKVAKFLLEIGATPNTVNSDNFSPLHTAIAHDKPEIANMILDYNPNVNLLTTYNQSSLHLATHLENHYKIIDKILKISKSTLDVQKDDKDGLNAIMMAVYHSSVKTVKLLIEAGANLTATDKGDVSVFMHAAIGKHNKNDQDRLHICKLLIAAGANTSIPKGYGILKNDIYMETEFFRVNPIEYIRNSDLSEQFKNETIERLKMRQQDKPNGYVSRLLNEPNINACITR